MAPSISKQPAANGKNSHKNNKNKSPKSRGGGGGGGGGGIASSPAAVSEAASSNAPERSRAASGILVAAGCAVALALGNLPWPSSSFYLANLVGDDAPTFLGGWWRWRAGGSSSSRQDADDLLWEEVPSGDLGERSWSIDAAQPLPPGELRPRDLPGPKLFEGFDTESVARIPIDSDGSSSYAEVPYRQGQVLQINRLAKLTTSNGDHNTTPPPVFSTVTHLPGLVPRETVRQLRQILEQHAAELDVDPDTVDGMPTYEVFVDSVELRRNAPTNKLRDDPIHNDERRSALRKTLQQLTEPHAERMAALVRAIHPDLCNATLPTGERRFCTPCYSLIRRYRHGERRSHPPHYDGHARVTIVVSLSEYGHDYTGGLYVATGHGPQREFFNLSMGDAVLHPSTLLHGVHVYSASAPRPASQTERWSWILWFRDSESCQDHSLHWFEDCAAHGNPLCQQFQASKVVHQYTEQERQHHLGNSIQAEASRKIMELNTLAARGGAAEAAVKVARAYLKQLPSDLEFDVDRAREYFQIAIDSHSSEGHYGMAQILVAEASAFSDKKDLDNQQSKLREAVVHLERAALSLHAFACFNLGIAHIYGYGVPQVNLERGAEWLVQSGLPEGLFLASQYAASIGDRARHDRWLKQAVILGWDQPWRVEARRHTGSGGAAGVDLNLMWPPSVARGGIQPPEL